ncbi:MAG: hypothetical protein ACUVX8_15275, partial [Candidatus Zipacnadales bacterium]
LAGRITLKTIDDAYRVTASAPLAGAAGGAVPHPYGWIRGPRAFPTRTSAPDPGGSDLGLPDNIWLDEACLMFSTDWWTPVQWTVGRQFFSLDRLGLVADNERLSLQGIRGTAESLWGTDLNFDMFFGGASYDEGFSLLNEWSDGYGAFRLAYETPHWALGGTWLATGHSEEEAWGADVWFEIWDRDIAFEYAEMLQTMHGVRPAWENAPSAWMGTAEVWETGSFKLTGTISRCSGYYDPTFSATNPYFELIDYGINPLVGQIPWERWMRAPLIIPGARIIAGDIDFEVGNIPMHVRYANVTGVYAGYNQWPWGLYEHLVSASATKEIVDGLSVQFTYARQMAENGTALDDIDLLQASAVVEF